MDTFDRKILRILQQDARIANQRLADQVGLSPSACLRRVQRLQTEGVIMGYAAHLRRESVGLSILAFVHISLEDHHPETLKKFDGIVAAAEEVLECHSLSGQYDYLLKVVARDVPHFEQFLRGELLANRGVNAANTSFVLQQRKSTTALPL